jgi:hypothetical protein
MDPLNGNVSKEVTVPNNDYLEMILFSPDGKWMAYKLSTKNEIYISPYAEFENKVLTWKGIDQTNGLKVSSWVEIP